VSEVRELVAQLVSIDSVNPGLVDGAPGEGRIAALVADWCRAAGLEVELEEPAPGRPNVLARARGSGGGRSLALNAHLDTVGTDGMEHPLEPRVVDARLYGRGSFDMKGSLAAAMVATKEAARLGLAGDVVLTAVIDEEVASQGTTAALARLRPDAAIVCEPTQLKVAVAHRGFVGFEIVTRGVAAHGGRPDLGVDAIVKMGHVLVGLGALDRSLRDGPGHPLLRSGSLHAGLVEGGVGFSTYPDRCLLQGERRTVPGETLEQIEGELEAVLAAAARDDPGFRGEWRVVLARSPFEVSEREEVVRLVLRHAGEAVGVGETYWADSALYDEAAVPAVLFGPAGEGAHADVEWVDLPSVERCVEVYTAVAADFCR
jgi:acetylornithine deacetylase